MHFDKDKLMERLDNDVELIDQLLLLTKEYLKEFIPILENLIAENNISAIKSHVHKMKGTALSVCFSNIAEQTAALELIENYTDEKFLILKAKMTIEINYLIKMIDGKLNIFSQ
ncbi:MAG: Hpt domain-containing protein [Bacteroidia bacterium]